MGFCFGEMINAQNALSNSISEIGNGTLQDWYGAVDESLERSEVIRGQYETRLVQSYESQAPIEANSETKIDISTDRYKIIDLENSFIEAKVEFNPEIGVAMATGGNAAMKLNEAWGYEDSFDLFESYKILSNTDPIYTQNYPHYESYILHKQTKAQTPGYRNTLEMEFSDLHSEEVFTQGVPANNAAIIKKKALKTDGTETFARITSEFAVSETRPANTVIYPTAAAKFELYFRIPLTKIPLLKDLKYFPGFWGTFTFNPTLGYSNMVEYRFARITTDAAGKIGPAKDSTNMFYHNVNTTYDYMTDDATVSKVSTNGRTYIRNFRVTQFRARYAEYMIQPEIYNSLQLRYAAVPLIMPIQTIEISRFATPIGTTSSGIVLNSTASLKHCSMMEIVFNRDAQDRTIFRNPMLSSFQVNIDGKMYPRESLATFNDTRFVNMWQDAFNVNNNHIVSVSDDIHASLFPTSRTWLIGSTTGVGNLKVSRRIDDFKFGIAIPFCKDSDFQGGLNTNGTVQIEFRADRGTPKGIATGNAYAEAVIGSQTFVPATSTIGTNSNFSQLTEDFSVYDWKTPATCIFVSDTLLKIRSVKPATEPQWVITNASVEQLMAGVQ